MSAIAVGACLLWQENQLLDYTIEVEDEQFKVHKVIMASVSDYFKVMLTGAMVESQTDRVRLEGLNVGTLRDIISLIYTGRPASMETPPEELLSCSVYLQMPAITEHIIKNYLMIQLSSSNCFSTLRICQTYSLQSGIDGTTAYIKSNMDSIMQTITERTYDCFLTLIQLWVKSEWQLFESIKQWAAADPENRCQHQQELMTRVRFPLMTREQLDSIKRMDDYSDSEGGWCELVRKAEEYQRLPAHLKVLITSDECCVRTDPVPMFATFNDGDETTFYSLSNGKSWKRKVISGCPYPGTGITAAIEVNNFLVVAVEHGPIKQWNIVDPCTLGWYPMSQMTGSRADFALVHQDKKLYALGGCTEERIGTGLFSRHEVIKTVTDTIEQYDFEKDTWTILPIKMPVPTAFHGAGVIDNCIYTAGGCKSDMMEFSKRLDRLDLTTGTWESRTPLDFEPFDKVHNKVQVMELWGEEVLFILHLPDEVFYYSPSTDQWSIANGDLGGMDTYLKRSWHSKVLPRQNTLYLLNFDDGTKAANSHSNDDSYDEWINEWANEAPFDYDGVCAKWVFDADGEGFTEVRLGDFPISRDAMERESHMFAALLSISPSADEQKETEYTVCTEYHCVGHGGEDSEWTDVDSDEDFGSD